MDPRFRMSAGGSKGPCIADVHIGVPMVSNNYLVKLCCIRPNADWPQLVLQHCPTEWLSEPHRRNLQSLWPPQRLADAVGPMGSRDTKDISQIWTALQARQLNWIGSTC